MATFLIILFFLAVWHLAYESIFASSYRKYIRNRMESLIAEIYRLRIHAKTQSEIDALDYVGTTLRKFELNVEHITLSSHILIMKFMKEHPDDVDKANDQKEFVLENSPPRVEEITQVANELILKSLLVNSGGNVVYLLVLLVLSLAMVGLFRMFSIAIFLPFNFGKNNEIDTINHDHTART